MNVCRGCGSTEVELVLSLGDMPIVNALPDADAPEPDPRYPLELVVCRACSLAQIAESRSPDELFTDYTYFSSYSDSFVRHAELLAEHLIAACALGADSLVCEVASNDGYLLQHYVHRGVPVLGIDPADNVAQVARDRGVPTISDYFGTRLATELASEGRAADVIHAHNVLAHVPEINDFVAGLATLLAPDGVVVVETPYVRNLVERVEFDTIYHEHVFYYSLTAIDRLFRANGLVATDVEHVQVHGGSLRIFARHEGSEVRPPVKDLLAEEERIGLTSPAYYRTLSAGVEQIITELSSLIERLRSAGERVAAYGASAKGAVLLNTAGLGRSEIDFVADRSPHKQGRLMPGVRIPIVEPERILADRPDAVLLLVWNIAEEILSQQATYRRAGGRFIIPVPAPRIVR